VTTVPVYWLSRHEDTLARGYADQGLLEALLDRSLWRPPAAVDFDHHEFVGNGTLLPEGEGGVVIINARSHTKDVRWLSLQLRRLPWVLLLLCGDEEWGFPWQELRHRRMVIYAMQPRPEHRGLGLLPGGWYPGTRERLRLHQHTARARPLDWFFAGQVTHERREACAEQLRQLPGGELYETDGYLQEAISRDMYFERMAEAKVAPSPSGPYTPDCARAFEALEAGCVPLLDLRSPLGPDFDYWELLLGDHGAPTIDEWSALPWQMEMALAEWPANANRVYSRWQQWKRELSHSFERDVWEVGELPDVPLSPSDQVTAIVTTSPVPRHPETDHIVETISSIRAQLPDAEILVVADGVRPEQEAFADDYQEYLRRLLWLTNFQWPNVCPIVLDEWGHQANAVRAALELVRTPLVLFAEHDCPLDGEIDWEGLCRFVASGQANAIRFHEDVDVHPDHEGLMLDPPDERWHGGGSTQPLLRRTAAWWQRPHLASTRFYRNRVMPFFEPESRTMIEDVMYGIITSDYADYGEAGWWDWRLFVYAPEGSMLRSRHLDSRGDEPKYPMRHPRLRGAR